MFYDLTSTTFEGHGPPILGAHGHSRDGEPRNRQCWSASCSSRLAATHHVFAGNWRDAKTVPDVLDDLETRFGLRRVVLVGDRGMVTSANLARLRERKHGYVVGLQRRREAVYRYIEQATGPWTDCPVGRARERAEGPKPGAGSRERQTGAPRVRRAERGAARLRAHPAAHGHGAGAQHLAALEKRVTTGQLTAPAKIGAAAARILTRAHGYRYYDWEYRDGRFRFFEHPVNPRENRPTKAST